MHTVCVYIYIYTWATDKIKLAKDQSNKESIRDNKNGAKNLYAIADHPLTDILLYRRCQNYRTKLGVQKYGKIPFLRTPPDPDSAWIRILFYNSPPARWGLLDFMSVASSCLVLLLLSSSSSSSSLSSLSSLSSSSSCSTATRDPQCSLSDLNHDHPRPVFPAGPQPRPSTPSVPCRTSATTIHAQCSLPDLNHDHPRPVFPAGPQPRPSTPSVPCRTSTASIHAKRYAT